MPDKNILSEGHNREKKTLEILLWGKAMRSAITLEEYIQMSIAQGISKKVLKDTLIQDLTEGGRIFGEFRRAVQSTAKGSLNRMRDVAEFSEIGVNTKYRWSAVLVNTCPDCLERHGQVKEWEDWENEGLPRSGQTVCKENCKCMLIPADTTEIDPIKRVKK